MRETTNEMETEVKLTLFLLWPRSRLATPPVVRLPDGYELSLRMGFVPYLYAGDMAERWKRICAEVDWPFTPEEWVIPAS